MLYYLLQLLNMAHWATFEGEGWNAALIEFADQFPGGEFTELIVRALLTTFA